MLYTPEEVFGKERTMMKTMKLIGVLAAAAVVSAALAQDQGGPPAWSPTPDGQGAGGGFRGGARGPMGMRPMGGPALLMIPEVQKELKLSKEQIEKLREILPQRGPGGPGGRMNDDGGPPRGGDDGGGPPPGDGGQGGPPRFGGGDQDGPPPQFGGGFGGPGQGGFAAMDRKVKGVLSSDQFERYQQIDLQVQGAHAVLRPDIAKKLEISDDQRQEIMDALRGNRPPRLDRGQDPEEMRAAMKAFREKQDHAVLAILTDGQKETWKTMLGKHFELPAPPHRQ